MSNIKLHGERIAVAPIYETQTKGGLALPQGSHKRLRGETLRGIVTAISKDGHWERDEFIRHVPPYLVGKVVHYYAGQLFEIIVDEQAYHIIDMGTMLCVEDNSGNTGTIDKTD